MMIIKRGLQRLSVILAAVFPSTALAQMTMAKKIPMGATDIQIFFNNFCNITNWIFAFVLVGAVVAIIFSAVAFLTSAGDASKVTTARNFLLYALIGVAIAILAKAFIAVVGSFVGVQGITAFLCN